MTESQEREMERLAIEDAAKELRVHTYRAQDWLAGGGADYLPGEIMDALEAVTDGCDVKLDTLERRLKKPEVE